MHNKAPKRSSIADKWQEGGSMWTDRRKERGGLEGLRDGGTSGEGEGLHRIPLHAAKFVATYLIHIIIVYMLIAAVDQPFYIHLPHTHTEPTLTPTHTP